MTKAGQRQRNKMERLEQEKERKMLELKGSFFDVQKTMYALESGKGSGGSFSGYLRHVLDLVDEFKERVQEYTRAEDAIVIALSDAGPRPGSELPTPGELQTGKKNNVPWGEFPEESA